MVGLGNPGKEYQFTRHNLGFEALDLLASSWGLEWKTERRWKSELALGPGLYLLKPLTWMNLSGEAVGSFCSYYRIPPSEILLILDDFALEIGRLRLRPSGSSGGHNGLASVLEKLGTQAVARLRIGIGSPRAGEDPADYVLRVPPPQERAILEQAIAEVPKILALLRDKGLEAAMNFANSKKPTQNLHNEPIRSVDSDRYPG